jgi:hypothetical protein
MLLAGLLNDPDVASSIPDATLFEIDTTRNQRRQ